MFGRRRQFEYDPHAIVGGGGYTSPRPTLEMLADARRRNTAPRSATAWLMGDPAPGHSALDRLTSNDGNESAIESAISEFGADSGTDCSCNQSRNQDLANEPS